MQMLGYDGEPRGNPGGATLPSEEVADVAPQPPEPVLVVTPWYPPAVGGVAEMAERLHTGLTAAGVTSYLLVNGGARQLTPMAGVARGYRMQIPGSVLAKPEVRNAIADLFRGVPAVLRLLRFVRSRGIRTIFLIYPSDYSWPFPLLRRVTGCVFIPVLQGNDVETYAEQPPSVQWVLRQVLESADTIVACAPHLGDSAERIVGRRLPVRVIPNCVDTQHFTLPPAGYRRTRGEPTILHVSNFATKKRTHDIVAAFARARLPAGTRLVMVGAGPTLASTKRLAEELGVAQHVEFTGARADVRPSFWAADVFVLASESEGAPLVLTESMACGVPWISTAWGAAAETPPEACGLVVPIHDPDALAEALSRLMADDELRRSMARRARVYAEERYSRDSYVKQHLSLLTAAKGRPAATPPISLHQV
jgi:glycosyltransferase involved in cell wall biosynthesis